MNKKQKIVIGVGLGLILLSGLFPYYGTRLGYGFIFFPPRVGWYRVGMHDNRRAAPIQFSRFYMQVTTISLLTIGLTILFAGPKKNKKEKDNKSHEESINE